MNLRLSSETLHASTVSLDGRAVLIMGPSGSGKSDLALRLLDRGVEAVGAAEHGHLHEQVALGFIGFGQTLAFVSNQQETRLFVSRLEIVVAGVEAGPDQLARPGTEPGDEFVPARGRDLLREDRAHRGADRFDRIGVGMVIDQDQPARSGGVARAEDGTDVARIAKRLRHQPERGLRAVDRCQRRVRLAIGAEDGLRIILAAHFREDVRRGLDYIGACFLGLLDDSTLR